ncbi:hypothetical protein BX611_2319 [Lutibacter oceani]|uniref:Uncharacterized protein n=1 Tax=Lutibacter oceani TaxID=1853311 RepID=A0A3D9RLB2_9FLAO|nr:hypothetical protein [Lutibacter oceani]REE80670.1 hypothetical protein BX611_2319 [Lutibacter oceani]
MFLKKPFLIIAVLFFSIGTSFSQEINIDFENPFLPKSIYSLNISTETSSPFNINNKLNLKQYKFVVLNTKNLEEGYFTIPIENMGKIPSKYIFDTYQKIYNNMKLKSSFFNVSDLYRVPFRNKN